MRIFKKTLFLQTMLLLSIHVLLLPISANAQDATISQMVATYNANQARFHAQHRGKVISGVGTVKSIEADLLGTGRSFNVVLDINKSRVDCRTQNKSVAASLDKGQKINFSGTVYDVVGGTLIATECSFSSVEIQPQVSQNMHQSKPPVQPKEDGQKTKNISELLPCKGPNDLVLACKTDRQIIAIYDFRSSCFGSGNFGYKSWNNPKTMTEKPDVNLIGRDSVSGEGSGICSTRVASFKTGNINYKFSEIRCSDGSEPKGTVGEITVEIDGVERMRKWCKQLDTN